MTTTAQEAAVTYAYRAHGPDGTTISGTIDAADIEEAQRKLESLHLRLLELAPAERPPKAAHLGVDDFVAFNQQLAHLTAAGLPLEHGLRIIAEDMRAGRLAQTIRRIASELEAGRPLAEVFQEQRGSFPASYGRMLEAGVRAGNLSAVLFNLARHLKLLGRLRGMLWQATAYPLMVLVGLSLVLIFLGAWVMPHMRVVFASMKHSSSIATWMLYVWPWLTIAAGTILCLLAISPALAWLLRRLGMGSLLLDHLVLRLPLIGDVMHKSILAAWCDASWIGVENGMDLPTAIALAADATPSDRLRNESRRLVERLQSGQDPGTCPRGQILPATVLSAMSLGMAHHDLPRTMQVLSELYQQQAEMRLTLLPTVLTPAMIAVTGVVVAAVAASVFLPLVQLFAVMMSF